MFWKIKLKSFGLAESVLASVIVVVVLSAAIALSSGAIKTTEVNASYTEAQHLSDKIFESINLIKSSGQTYFDAVPRGGDIIKIDCFDSEYYRTNSLCQVGAGSGYPLDQIPFLGSSYINNGFYNVPATMLDNPAFTDNYFSYKVEVRTPEACNTSGSINIPQNKCRIVTTEIKWEEASGEKYYKQGMYLTDWER